MSTAKLRYEGQRIAQALAFCNVRRSTGARCSARAGSGSAGRATAALAQHSFWVALVLAYRKLVCAPPVNVDRLYCADQRDGIDDIQTESDVVLLCIRRTDATHHMIGEGELRHMKRSVFLINRAGEELLNAIEPADMCTKGQGSALDPPKA
jgi:lactate dehydrogenase-like 2-hydroxyacid dehydrogenase